MKLAGAKTCRTGAHLSLTGERRGAAAIQEGTTTIRGLQEGGKRKKDTPLFLGGPLKNWFFRARGRGGGRGGKDQGGRGLDPSGLVGRNEKNNYPWGVASEGRF